MKNFNKVPLIGVIAIALVSIVVSAIIVAIIWLIGLAVVVAVSNPTGILAAFFVCFVITFTSVLYLVSGDENG